CPGYRHRSRRGGDGGAGVGGVRRGSDVPRLRESTAGKWRGRPSGAGARPRPAPLPPQSLLSRRRRAAGWLLASGQGADHHRPGAPRHGLSAAHGICARAPAGRRRDTHSGRRRALRNAAGAGAGAAGGRRRYSTPTGPGNRMSLRFRLNLAITLMIVIFTIATGKIIVDDMRRSIREEIEAGTRVTVQLLETVIASAGAQNHLDGRNEALLSFLRHVGRVRANEIRYYDSNDVLLYVSP